MAARYLSRFGQHALLWLAVATPLLIAGPLTMFAANYGDFDIGLKQLATLILPYLVIPALGACVTAILPLQTPLRLVLIWTALALYLQGNIVVWDYGRFDGTDIPWDEFSYRGYADAALWLGTLGVVIFARRRIAKDIVLLALGLIVIQIGSAVMAFNRSGAPSDLENAESSEDALYAFSKARGALVIVLDEFSSQALYSMLASQPNLKRELADFTYYRDVLAAFPTTYAALPAIITGQPAPTNGSLAEYFETASGDAINEQLARAGWSSEVVTFHPICKKFKDSRCRSLSRALSKDKKSAARREAMKLLDLTLFRHAPHAAKKAIYNDENWFLQRQGAVSLSPNHQSSIRFAEMFEAGITGDAKVPSFKFLHLLVPHGPYNLTPECGRYTGPSIAPTRKFSYNAQCALRIVGNILNRMKAAGVYDSTTIVLLADHGTPIGFDVKDFGPVIHKNLRRALPLLLVKPAGFRAAPNEEMKTDSNPISQLEILGLINQVGSLGLRVPETRSRTPEGDRIFHNYAWSHDNWSSDSLPKVTSWAVKGNSWSMDSWRKLSTPSHSASATP